MEVHQWLVFRRSSLAFLQSAWPFSWGRRASARHPHRTRTFVCLKRSLIQATPGSLPAVSYSVRDIGRVAGAVRLALPEAGGHALVLTETGKVWAWGDNRTGQLGVGDTRVRPEWVAVAELDSVVAIAAGTQHSVAAAARRQGVDLGRE